MQALCCGGAANTDRGYADIGWGEEGGRTESTFKHIEELCRYRKKCDAASTEGICRYWVQIYTDRDVQTLIIASTRKRDYEVIWWGAN